MQLPLAMFPSCALTFKLLFIVYANKKFYPQCMISSAELTLNVPLIFLQLFSLWIEYCEVYNSDGKSES